MSPEIEKSRWEQVAERLEALNAGPTTEQAITGTLLGVALARGVPATVAAVILKDHLANVLFERTGRAGHIPQSLIDLEYELGITNSARLLVGTDGEVSAWFAARYMLMTARGLRDARPEVGDVVTSHGWAGERRVISSISDAGRVHLKGRPTRMAWPNHLDVIKRVGEVGYEDEVRSINSALLNGAARKEVNFDRLRALEPFALSPKVPSAEAIRGLEELLESGETREEPFQALITQHPELLASTVVGGWKTYVIPKQRLGSEHVPDFLVLGISSIGPQWLLVEIEAARHKILNQDGTLSGPTRHAIKQIQNWGEWLTENVAYAQNELNLFGLTNRAPGLVVIGRDGPTTQRSASRARSEETQKVAVHSWDWILRCARNLTQTGFGISDLARANAGARVGFTFSGDDDSDFIEDVERLDADEVF